MKFIRYKHEIFLVRKKYATVEWGEIKMKKKIEKSEA